MDIYVARQPIFDRNMSLYGYELLYRKSSNNFYEGIDHSEATAELVHNTFLVMGFHQLIEGTRGFINFNQDLLEKDIPSILPKDKVVIEILENVEANDSVINACKKLKKDGFKIALDDFVFDRTDLNYMPLIELADIIKVEFPSTEKGDQRNLISKYKSKIMFLAEKVETREEYKEAVEMGYELFQGYFFSKPMMMKSKEIGTLNIHLVRILEELQKSEPSFDFITDTIQKDLGLSYKLLTMANSIYFGGKYSINGLKQAVVRLGIKEMKQWISIMLLREFENEENKELIKMCLLRGRILSLIAHERNQGEMETDYFLVGILSSIDVILNSDMEKILDPLALSEALKDALLKKEGGLAECLNCVLLYERFELDRARQELRKINIPLERFMELYIEALEWLRTTNG
ncbi:MAG: HDOD domain-containing protein [Bacillota bacterium]